jgi:hypothetical protein
MYIRSCCNILLVFAVHVLFIFSPWIDLFLLTFFHVPEHYPVI